MSGYTKKRFLQSSDPEEWLELIEELLKSREYDWAEDTLLDIGETIEESGKVTPGQTTAIKNIMYVKGNW